jgi:hypothetical protein
MATLIELAVFALSISIVCCLYCRAPLPLEPLAFAVEVSKATIARRMSQVFQRVARMHLDRSMSDFHLPPNDPSQSIITRQSTKSLRALNCDRSRNMNQFEAAVEDNVQYFQRLLGVNRRRQSIIAKIFDGRKKEKVVANRAQFILLATDRNAYGMTPVHIACLCNGHKCLFFFLTTFAEDSKWLANLPCHTSARQWSFPLHLAIINGGHGRLVKQLLKAGADPFLKDSQGQTAWDVARASYRKRAWNRMRRHILKHQPKHAPQLMGSQLIFQRSNSSTANLQRQTQRRRLSRSTDALVIEKSTKLFAKKPVKIPPGPWDLDCFRFTADTCGREPAGETSLDSASTSTTNTQSTQLCSIASL